MPWSTVLQMMLGEADITDRYDAETNDGWNRAILQTFRFLTAWIILRGIMGKLKARVSEIRTNAVFKVTFCAEGEGRT